MFYVDTNSFKRNGGITGKISFFSNDYYFPERDWSDFPVVIFGWWAESLMAFIRGSNEVEFSFMDGPFKVMFANTSEFLTRIEFYHNSMMIHSQLYDKKKLIESCKKSYKITSNLILDTCNNNNWGDRDVVILSKRLVDIQKLA